MKPIKTISGHYFKFLLELIVIFVSVVLAFLFDDYREAKNLKNQYKEDLSALRLDLAGEIHKDKLDSFRIVGDPAYRGKDFERLLNLIWLEDLIEKKKARMKDFKYIIESDYLETEAPPASELVLLEEFLKKYNGLIQGKSVQKFLRIYAIELIGSNEFAKELEKRNQDIYEIIKKTNPYYKFSKSDSLLFYSNEFIWAYKSLIESRKSEYKYNQWLSQKRFIRVMDALNAELESLDIPFPPDKQCYQYNNYQKYIECVNHRAINEKDSLQRIEDIVITNREEYLRSH